ncbi:MAG: hypothetical protein IKQ91_07065 [Oscillospiraceae bacterium]|nr:hypothetical protein [Oscillospiraceae bacterium]
MDDWKERLKAEYAQTKERYEELKAWNNKREVAAKLAYCTPCCSDADAAERRKQEYHDDLTVRQQHTMGEYLHILELRASLDGIEL